MSKSSKEISQKSKVTVEIVKVTLEQIKEYIDKTRNNGQPPSSISLNDYLSSLSENKLIIADLSEVSFNIDENKNRRENTDLKRFAQTKDVLIDLRGVDFSGSRFGESLDARDYTGKLIKNKSGEVKKSKKFNGVDLTGAIFRDTNLNNTSFKNSNLNNVDFRGADLSSTKFNKTYQDLIKSGKGKYVEGIQFSSTPYLMRDYAGIKPDFKNQVPSIMEKDKIVNESLKYIFGSNSAEFDPMYTRGSSERERNQKKEFIKLTDDEVKEYLTIIKGDNKKDFALNDFARVVALNRRNKQMGEDIEVIADFSGKANNLNEWVSKDDLFEINSGIRKAKFDFRGANLSRVNFAGADLEGYDFTGCVLNSANFEGANLKRTTFNNTQAKDTNCFNADFSNADITNQCSFRRAFMAKSKAQNMTTKDSDFRYTDIKSGKWNGVILNNIEADFANISDISMNDCSLVGVRLRRAKADRIKMNGKSKLIEVDASFSSMQKGEAKGADITNCYFDNVEAQEADFSNATFEGLSGKNMNLESAVCEKVTFINGDLDGANAKNVNFNGTKAQDTSGKVIVNEATTMDKETDMSAASILFVKKNDKGKDVTISTQQHQEEQIQANIAKEHEGVSNRIGSTLKSFGRNLKGKGEIVDKPFSTVTGAGVGLVSGGIVAAGIAVAVIAVAGPVLIPLAGVGLVAGVAGGCILAGIVAGGVAGGIIAKNGGICGVAALAAGTLIAGPIGAAIGAFAYFKANKIAKKYTGYDMDTLVSTPLYATGSIAEGIGAGIDPSTENGKKTQNLRAQQQKRYQEKADNISTKPGSSEDLAGDVRLKIDANLDKEKEKAAKTQDRKKNEQHQENTIEKAKEKFNKYQNKSKAANIIDRFKRKVGITRGKS